MILKMCPTCGGEFDADMGFCPNDGARLQMPSVSKEDALLGAILAERYRVKDKLGAGGMGSVYRAHNINAEMDVALKILDPIVSTRGELAARFQREKRVISKLRHPNILKLLDSFTTEDNELVIVTELVDGQTLSDHLDDGPLGPRTAMYIVREVADALVEAHEGGVVHRDLKPSNLMLEQAGDRQMVKILDFGIAKDLGDDGFTTSGTLGTPSYMSPEQIRGLQLDGRSDIYSLGCIAYECLTGSVLFRGGTAFDIVRRHLTDTPRALAEHDLVRALPAGLQNLITRMLAKEPADRFDSARSLRLAVDSMLRDWDNNDAPLVQLMEEDNSVGFDATHSRPIVEIPSMAPSIVQANGVDSSSTVSKGSLNVTRARPTLAYVLFAVAALVLGVGGYFFALKGKNVAPAVQPPASPVTSSSAAAPSKAMRTQLKPGTPEEGTTGSSGTAPVPRRPNPLGVIKPTVSPEDALLKPVGDSAARQTPSTPGQPASGTLTTPGLLDNTSAPREPGLRPGKTPQASPSPTGRAKPTAERKARTLQKPMKRQTKAASKRSVPRVRSKASSTEKEQTKRAKAKQTEVMPTTPSTPKPASKKVDPRFAEDLFE